MTKEELNIKCATCEEKICHDGYNFCNEAMKENSFYKNKRLYKGIKPNKKLSYAELEEKISILLSCNSCPDNKGGLLCQKEYEDKCLSQKIQYIKELKEEIAELEKENEELKERNAKLKGMYAYSAREASTYKQFLELKEKENTELNDKLNNLSKVAEVRLANWQKYEQENKELKERNNKAKELLEDLIKFQPYIDREAFFISLGNEWKTAIYRAEQFLKECE